MAYSSSKPKKKKSKGFSMAPSKSSGGYIHQGSMKYKVRGEDKGYKEGK